MIPEIEMEWDKEKERASLTSARQWALANREGKTEDQKIPRSTLPKPTAMLALVSSMSVLSGVIGHGGRAY